jgi:hypothetical protein
MKLRPKYFLLTIVVVLGILYAGNFLILRASEAERLRTFGKYNEPQVVALAEALCCSLRPVSERLSYATRKTTLQSQNGINRIFWQVHCADANGRGFADLEWDAQTGEIAAISRLGDVDLGNVHRIRNPQQAERAALEWLMDLNIVRKNAACTLMQPPQHTGPVWYVHFCAGERVLRAAVHAGTGDLMTLQARRAGERR